MHGITGAISNNPCDLTANNLLRSLRREDALLLEPLASEWWGDRGKVLHEPGDVVRQVYFPCGSSMISYLVVLEDGRAIETALIGREGAAGGIVSQGHLPAYARAEVQFPGTFIRIDLARLEDAKARSAALRNLFARYADCLVAQVFQAVACNAAHTIEQRTARWLIAAIQRTGTLEIPLTQDQLAAMLGVGRSYISRVIASLKDRDVLGTRRGVLVIPDLARLQALACGCHDAVLDHFDEVLSGVYPSEEELVTVCS